MVERGWREDVVVERGWREDVVVGRRVEGRRGGGEG